MNQSGREEWIGWPPTQWARRLGFVVNNSRYLLLPDRHVYPNLGSKVLSLYLKRLSGDWEQVWGQPVLAVATDAAAVITTSSMTGPNSCI